MRNIKPLTTLRFFFAIMIFLHHFVIFNSLEGTIDKFLLQIADKGYLGVSFFFLLSGFILSYVYDKEDLSKIAAVKKFYLYRVAKIYPLHLLTFILAAMLIFFFLKESLPTLGNAIANLLLIHSFTEEFASFNTVTWSISNEMFFYLCFPLLLYITRFINAKVAFGLLTAMAGILFMAMENFTADAKYIFYIHPVVRLADFFAGMLLYRIARELKDFTSSFQATLFEIFSIALFAAFFFFQYYFPVQYSYSWYYWLPLGIMLLVFFKQQGSISEIFSRKLFVYSGEISYGFYMWHYIVIIFFSEISKRTGFVANPYVLFLIVFGCVYAISILSYRYVEKPLHGAIRNWVK